MIAITRWLLGLFKNENQLLSNYRKSHSHFIRYLCLDAFLSVIVVIGGFQIAASYRLNPMETLLERSGSIGMSVDTFIDHIKNEDKSIYWIGPISQNKYTINCCTKDMYIVTYIPKIADLNNPNQPKLTVTTYENIATYAAHVRPLMGSDIVKRVTIKGNTVEFNGATLNREIVTLADKSQIVVIHYPIVQNEQILMSNADKLRLVR